jgi:hypothetical protein
MERLVVYVYGLWFWLTRAWRVVVYSEAAATLELAHARLLQDYLSYASTRDRGMLLPFHHEALGILQHHAVNTYVTATRFATLRECCKYVSEELRQEDLRAKQTQAHVRPAPVVLQPAPSLVPVRARFRPGRAFTPPRLPAFAQFLSTETSRWVWDRRPTGPWRLRTAAGSSIETEPADQPLKAA